MSGDIGNNWELRAVPSTAPGGGGDHELQFWNVENSPGTAALRIVHVVGAGFRLLPGGANSLQFGDTSRPVLAIHADELYERRRGVASGVPQQYVPSFAAAAGTWTGVAVAELRYAFGPGQRVDVDFELDGGTLSHPTGSVSVSLPPGVVAAHTARNLIQVENANSFRVGMARVSTGAAAITFYGDLQAQPFAPGTLTVRGQLSFFVR